MRFADGPLCSAVSENPDLIQFETMSSCQEREEMKPSSIHRNEMDNIVNALMRKRYKDDFLS